MQVRLALGSVDAASVARISIRVGQKNVKQPKGRHYILVEDCSASMTGSIQDVSHDSQKFVVDLTSNDFVSVIVFSGHGRARRIAGPTRMDEAGKRLVCVAIKAHVRIMDTTVFSEPLTLTLEAAKEAAGEDLMHHGVLFTDGCPVPQRWSVEEEKRKSLEEAAKLGKFGAVLSCLGYGVYYDDRFMRALVAANNGNGVYLHLSEIENFREAIEAIRSIAEKMSPVSIELSVSTEKGVGRRAYRTTPEVTRVGGDDGTIRLSALYEGAAEIFVELPAGAKKVDLSAVIGGIKIEHTTEKLGDDDQATYVRIQGVEAFFSGDLSAAQEAFDRTGDSTLADNLGGAFSTREVREVGSLIRGFFRDKRFIGAGLKKQGPSHNVLNALRTLINDPANVVFIPKGAYKRSGLLERDPRVIEQPLGSELRVFDYTSHEDRLNFSVRAKKRVNVLPEDGNGAPLSMEVYRSYNIVLDGNLHTPELLASLSEESFISLKEAGVIKVEETWRAGKTYTLNFRGLKMTSPAWAQPGSLGLVDLMRQEKELEAEQKALNAKRKELKEAGVYNPADDETVGVYNETAKPVADAPREYYTAPSCEYRLMGYEVEKVYDCSTLDYTAATKRVKEVRRELNRVRFLVRAIVFSCEVTKSRTIRWDAGKMVKRGKYEKLEQIADFNGAKLKRVTWEQECVCS